MWSHRLLTAVLCSAVVVIVSNSAHAMSPFMGPPNPKEVVGRLLNLKDIKMVSSTANDLCGLQGPVTVVEVQILRHKKVSDASSPAKFVETYETFKTYVVDRLGQANDAEICP